jgi:hypothetical protein
MTMVIVSMDGDAVLCKLEVHCSSVTTGISVMIFSSCKSCDPHMTKSQGIHTSFISLDVLSISMVKKYHSLGPWNVVWDIFDCVELLISIV